MMLKNLILSFLPTVLLMACTGFTPNKQELGPVKDDLDRRAEEMGKLGGGDGLLNEMLRGRQDSGGGTGIGVNAYLWQASLDTLSFMPLASADSFGGIIITDWYSPPETPQNRYKVTIYIIGRELRSDALRITSFKQRLTGNDWIDIGDQTRVNRQLEDAILTRARQMRMDARTIEE